jgi:hypothetical protein
MEDFDIMTESQSLTKQGGPMTDRETARDLSKRLEKAQEEIARLRGALEHYAECGDGCTCGDGWDHKTAQEALKETI